RIAAALGVSRHLIMPLDLRCFGGSALTADIPVPTSRDPKEMTDIPVTYVPARNTIFLALALAWAETVGAEDIFIGVNALDYSGYPDCRPEFIAAFQDLARIATKTGVEGSTQVTVHAPLIDLTKAEIVTAGTGLGVDYAITISCYDADDDGLACGRCDSCHLRHRGFVDAGLPDPTPYQPGAAPT
ncbi:MAG TPA: 7-cyano-7-deazaguanine synthase, partial [Gemmatimonadales bacterium]|nr:7-cyano-7-deazaguanine synthase [Gemmatimonadales bacterium]